MSQALWDQCLSHLERELSPQQFNTWIRPLHVIANDEEMRLLAPNRFVKDWIDERFLERIGEIMNQLTSERPNLRVEIGKTSRKVLLSCKKMPISLYLPVQSRFHATAA